MYFSLVSLILLQASEIHAWGLYSKQRKHSFSVLLPLTSANLAFRVTGMRIKPWIIKKLKKMLSVFTKQVKENSGRMNLALIWCWQAEVFPS